MTLHVLSEFQGFTNDLYFAKRYPEYFTCVVSLEPYNDVINSELR